MSVFFKSMIAISLFYTLPLTAGSGARYYIGQPAPIGEKVAVLKAKEFITTLIDKKKLDDSWGLLSAQNAEKKIYQDRPEWVILFVNDKIKDVEKKNLYIFMKLNGEFLAINHTGH